MSAKDAHVHYWKIEAARGSRALAYCRDCPATRSFATGWITEAPRKPTVDLHIRIPVSKSERLRDLARAENQTVSNLVATLVERHFQEIEP